MREEDEAEAIRLGSRALDLQRGLGRLAVGTPYVGERVPPAVMIPGAGPTVDFEKVSPGPARVLALQALRTMRVAAELQRLGRIPEALEEWRRAIDTHDTALELDDQLAGAYTNRGVALTEVEKMLRSQGRVMEATTDRMRAMGDFQRAYALEPKQVAVTLNLAAAWERHAIHLQGTEMTDQATEAMAEAVAYYRDALDDEGAGVLQEIAQARLQDAEEQLARLRGR